MLNTDGILVLNFVAFGQGEGKQALASVAKTINQVFPSQSLFVSEPGEDFNDYIFLASDLPVDLSSPSLSAVQSDWLNRRIFKVDSSKGIVLTDNLNPLEHLQTRKSEQYRHVLVEWFGNDLLVR